MRQYGILASAFVIGLAGCRTTRSESELAGPTDLVKALTGCKGAGAVCPLGTKCNTGTPEEVAAAKLEQAVRVGKIGADSKALAAAAGATALGVDKSDKGSVDALTENVKARSGLEVTANEKGEVFLGGKSANEVHADLVGGKLLTAAALKKIAGENTSNAEMAKLASTVLKKAGTITNAIAPEHVLTLAEIAGTSNPEVVAATGYALAAGLEATGFEYLTTQKDGKDVTTASDSKRPTAETAAQKITALVQNNGKLTAEQKIDIMTSVFGATNDKVTTAKALAAVTTASGGNDNDARMAVASGLVAKILVGEGDPTDWKKVAEVTGGDAKEMEKAGQNWEREVRALSDDRKAELMKSQQNFAVVTELKSTQALINTLGTTKAFTGSSLNGGERFSERVWEKTGRELARTGKPRLP